MDDEFDRLHNIPIDNVRIFKDEKLGNGEYGTVYLGEVCDLYCISQIISFGLFLKFSGMV